MADSDSAVIQVEPPPALLGLSVLCIGFDQVAKQEIQQLLARLGATPAFSYVPTVRRDAMVAASVAAPGYLVTELCTTSFGQSECC